MEQPQLCYQDGFRWFTQGNVTFKGYLYDEKGSFLCAQDAHTLFSKVVDEKDLTRLLKRIDGAFTVIIRLEQALLIGTDPMGMFPLLYASINGQWALSDHPNQILSKKNRWAFNEHALPEFHAAGFVLGEETLVKDVFRTRAGEILLLKNNGELKQLCYHYFLPKNYIDAPREELKKHLQRVLTNVCGRLLTSLGGKTAVVPLSGGYDSRLIACMLKMSGYNNVVCITYGRPGAESELSQKVAETLGYRWLFVDYRDIDPAGFYEDDLFRSYCDYTGMLSSMPYLQEFFAVKHLKERSLIPDDSIFLPGHTGDYIAGSYTEKTIRSGISRREKPKELVSKYFHFLRLHRQQKKQIEIRLKQWFADYNPPGASISLQYDIYSEDWDLKEKFSKFIFNSAKVFPFFGYQYRLPLWDAEFRGFFRELPFKYRSHKNLYDEVISEVYFKPLRVFFPGKEIIVAPETLFIKKIKDAVRPFMPAATRMHRMNERDYICYKKFTGELVKSMKSKQLDVEENINSYNAYICQWYCYEVRKQSVTP
jgi:asparagine synthase (glutamine-hydrolysing)